MTHPNAYAIFNLYMDSHRIKTFFLIKPYTKIRKFELTKSRTQKLVDRLRDLQISSPGIEGTAIISLDGLAIASSLPAEIEEDRVSAMSAAMISLGERIASELGRGTLDQVYVHGDKGYVILMAVGEEAVLTAMIQEDSKLGLILLDMKRAVKDFTLFL